LNRNDTKKKKFRLKLKRNSKLKTSN